jgi:hypothetical protein
MKREGRFSGEDLSVILTDAETAEAAARHVKSSVGKSWSGLSDNQKQGYRHIVTKLATKLDTPRTPEAVFVFMAWMGDPLN